MLHILLLILKIIGIILAIVLGILLVLIAIVIFVPIRYDISAKCEGDIESLKAKAKVTWMLHLFRADIFLKGKKLKWKARFAWFKRTNTVANAVSENQDKELKRVEEEKVICQNSLEEDDVSDNLTENSREKTRENTRENTQENSQENTKETLVDKLKAIIDKFKNLLQKKERLTEFLTNSVHVTAYKKTKKVLFIFLKKLRPEMLQGKVRFGFKDPSITGKAVGAISMFYPLFGDALEIIPDFERQIINGRIEIKGKIRLCHLVSLAIKLILCKDVRITYKDIRNFKL